MARSTQTVETREERWHTQTLAGGGGAPLEERGDCTRACITSILGLPIDAIENVHGDNWWERLNGEVARYGYTLAVLSTEFAPPDGYWIATVPSLSLPPEPNGSPALHCVVAKSTELIHDPGLQTLYSTADWTRAWNAGTVDEGWVLVPLDPVEVSRAATLRSPLRAPEGARNPFAGDR